MPDNNVDKITPNDPRIKHGYTEVKGHRWHYLDGVPQSHQKGTVVLVHGFPDMSLAWRYQIPMLMDLGLRCIAIDCMGYGGTGTSDKLEDFTFKNHADAIAGIAKAIGAPKIILGGHDWGGLVVYRVAQWYPELVSHVFSVATPYAAPMPQYLPTEALVQAGMKQFGYQLQFGSPDQQLEKVMKDEASIRKWLMGMYGGRPSSGKTLMTPEKGVDLEIIMDDKDEIGMTPLFNQEELDHYVSAYVQNGVNGPCNWYRTRQVNWSTELDLAPERRQGANQVPQPTLFIQCLHDNILIPKMSQGMEEKIPHLTRGEVQAAHWALWQTPQETNDIIKGWIEGVVFGGKSKI